MDSVIREGVQETEREIFYDALGEPNPDDDNERGYSDEDAENDGLDLPEGWDGEPLEQDEIAATNLYGHDENNFDRPLALAQEEDYRERRLAEDQQLRQAGAELDRQAFERQKGNWEIDVVTQPRQAVDVMLAQHAELQQLREARINTSMQAAHAEYGKDFEDAYRELTSMNPQDPAACAVVNSITRHPDPGGAMMNWYGAGGAGALGGVRAAARIPSLNSQQSAGRSFPSGDRGGWGGGESSWGSRSEEDAIFDSVFR